jgi:serine/threonine-protein kinase RsbW
MATVELSFTPLPAHVRTARLVATAVARRTGVEESLLDEVRLAVGEACSRAVEAHRLHCPGEPVRIRLSGHGGRFEVVVADAVAGGDGAAPRQAAGAGPGGAAAADDEPAGATVTGSEAADAASAAAAGTAGPAGAAAAGGPVTGANGAVSLGGDAGFPAGLGLAVIAGLADDVEISTTAAGISIRMSWPAVGRSPDG